MSSPSAPFNDSMEDKTEEDLVSKNNRDFIKLMIQSDQLNVDGVDREVRIAEMLDDVLETEQVDALIGKFRNLLYVDGKQLDQMHEAHLSELRSKYETMVVATCSIRLFPFFATEDEYVDDDEKMQKLIQAEKLNVKFQEQFNELLAERPATYSCAVAKPLTEWTNWKKFSEIMKALKERNQT